jgi:nucleotide-binding universal stress UspA family protein
VELRNVLVPVADNPESERAMDVACRLADEHRTTIAVLHVVEIPPVLPLGAHMKAEEQAAHKLLERMAAVADTYGVKVAPRMLHDRVAGEAIVGFAARREVDLIVIGAPRKRSKPFGSTVEHVLRRAASRVMLVGAAPQPDQVSAAA